MRKRQIKLGRVYAIRRNRRDVAVRVVDFGDPDRTPSGRKRPGGWWVERLDRPGKRIRVRSARAFRYDWAEKHGIQPPPAPSPPPMFPPGKHGDEVDVDERFGDGKGGPAAVALRVTVLSGDVGEKPHWRGRVYHDYFDGKWSNATNYLPAGYFPGALVKSVTMVEAREPHVVGWLPERVERVDARVWKVWNGTNAPGNVRDKGIMTDLLDTPGWARALARTITAGGWDDAQRATMIQDFLQGLTYSKTAPRAPAGADPTLYFLTKSGEGDCKLFASAFVLLCRAIGIPARFVGGYSGGKQDGKVWTVTNDKGHAWADAWIKEVGEWVEYDPTPDDGSGGDGDGSGPGTGRDGSKVTVTDGTKDVGHGDIVRACARTIQQALKGSTPMPSRSRLSGRLDVRRFGRALVDGRCFQRAHATPRVDAAVAICLDNSGSMKYWAQTARDSVRVMGDALDSLSIPFAIYGHIQKLPAIYHAFGARWTRRGIRAHAVGGTYWPHVTLAADDLAKRREAHKLLVILTDDGQPVTKEEAERLVRLYARKGITVVPIGIGRDVGVFPAFVKKTTVYSVQDLGVGLLDAIRAGLRRS